MKIKYGPPSYRYKALVLEVHDGDTFKISVDLGPLNRIDHDFGLHIFVENHRLVNHMTVRLNGCNAPELNTVDGKESRDALKRAIEGVDVIVTTHIDKTEKYGRLLADVMPTWGAYEGVNIAQWMIENAFAKAWDGRGSKPV